MLMMDHKPCLKSALGIDNQCIKETFGDLVLVAFRLREGV